MQASTSATAASSHRSQSEPAKAHNGDQLESTRRRRRRDSDYEDEDDEAQTLAKRKRRSGGRKVSSSSTARRHVKGAWCEEEDQKLRDLVSIHGPKKWSLIAQNLENRIGKQCRERWFNHLDPAVNKEPWTPAEDEQVMKYHAQFGNAWARISKLMPGRPANMIKNRWNSTLRRVLERNASGSKSSQNSSKTSAPLPVKTPSAAVKRKKTDKSDSSDDEDDSFEPADEDDDEEFEDAEPPKPVTVRLPAPSPKASLEPRSKRPKQTDLDAPRTTTPTAVPNGVASQPQFRQGSASSSSSAPSSFSSADPLYRLHIVRTPVATLQPEPPRAEEDDELMEIENDLNVTSSFMSWNPHQQAPVHLGFSPPRRITEQDLQKQRQAMLESLLVKSEDPSCWQFYSGHQQHDAFDQTPFTFGFFPPTC